MNRNDEARLVKAIVPMGMQMGEVMKLAHGAERPEAFIVFGEEIAQCMMRLANRVEAAQLQRILRDQMGSILARAAARQETAGMLGVPQPKVIPSV